MKKIKSIVIAFQACFLVFSLHAQQSAMPQSIIDTSQTHEKCGTMRNFERLIREDTTFAMQRAIFEAQINAYRDSVESDIPVYTYTGDTSSYDYNPIISAPIETGQIVSPSANCAYGGYYVMVTGMVANATYSISSICPYPDFSSAISIYPVSGQAIPQDSIIRFSDGVLFTPAYGYGGDFIFYIYNNITPGIQLLDPITTINARNRPQLLPPPVYTIPVVFHVVHQGEAIGDGKNISEALILNQLAVLNRQYSASNVNIFRVPQAFKQFIGNVNIKFSIAKRDAAGKATTGITRIKGLKREYDEALFDSLEKKKSIWDRDKYLNVWITTLVGDALGYGQFPGGPANTDGVVLDYAATVSSTNIRDSAATLAHEVGHWLNLYHIWGKEDDNCFEDDEVKDTPRQEKATKSNALFPIQFPRFDDCTDKKPGIMYMNYMDYTHDSQLYMFTKGQVDRMRDAFGRYRDKLRDSNGWGAKSPSNRLAGENVFDSPMSILVYPNPNNGSFTLSVNEEFDNVTLSVVNILGEKVYENITSDKKTNIDLRSQPNGVYFLKIIPIAIGTENGSTTKKIIISR